MYEQSLQQAGLTLDQALIYEVLLKNGPLKASKVHQKTPLKRGLVYKILEDLVKIGLVEKAEEPGKVSIFSPAHPLKLRDVAKEREQKARDAQVALDGVLGQLSSDYNLTIGKPGVEFFEGKEGLIQLYERILGSGQPIDSIEDKGNMVNVIGDYIPVYVKTRVQRGLYNRVITPATNAVNTTDQSQLREARTIPEAQFPFRLDIKIAGPLLSIVSLQKENTVGVLIDNKEIAENFKILFEYWWKQLTPQRVGGAPAPVPSQPKPSVP